MAKSKKPRRKPRLQQPQSIKFHESLAKELSSKRDRVRHLIGARHWGEEGRYKEEILKQLLHTHLPANLAIGTGFVIGQQDITSQIDIIIYSKSSPVLFRQGDFVILDPDGVRAIIEVKTSLTPRKLTQTVSKASRNGHLILSSHNDRTFQFFNGVFAYSVGRGTDMDYLNAAHSGLTATVASITATHLRDRRALVNHICLDDKWLHASNAHYAHGGTCNLMGFSTAILSASGFVFSLLSALTRSLSPHARSLYFPQKIAPFGTIPY